MTEPFSTEIAGKILEEIKQAKRILMHCHPSPDGDSLGSTLGLKHALGSLGKDITLIKGDSNLPGYLSMLPGYATIVEKNIFEVDFNQFDLFLILDSASLHQISKIKDLEFPKNLKTIVIDHHISNPGYADINLVDSTYPATCEIVYDLLKSWNIEITPDAALCLLIGIFTDTGGFRYAPTSPNTFKAAAELSSQAPNFLDSIFLMENNNAKGRLVLHGLLLQSIETHLNDSVAFASVSYDELQKHGIKQEEFGVPVVNEMKSVTGWNISVVFMEVEPGMVKMSFRTRDHILYDISKLAVEVGGGGHSRAAGAQIKGNLAEAKAQVLNAIKVVYPDTLS